MQLDSPPSWRADSAPSTQKGEAPSHDGTDWRVRTPESPRSYRNVFVAIGGVAILVVAGLLFWAGTWLRPPKPAKLILIGAGYSDNLLLPTNVYGWQGLQDLASWTRNSTSDSFWSRRQLQLIGEPLPLRKGIDWDKSLADFDGSTLVLFFSLHGGADEDGAYLLPYDATAANTSDNRVRISSVLDRLAKLPEKTGKLLVFDATRMRTHWRLGMLSNEFARALRDEEERIRSIPNLVVVCASDIDQLSWASPEWRQSAFTHFLIEALKGQAWTRQNEGRITAWDAFVTVRDNVERWVLENRGAVQQPILLPTGDEGEQRARAIDLAICKKGYRPPNPRSYPVYAPSDRVRSVWEKHQQLAAQSPPPEVYAPLLWRKYEAWLLRYDELIAAGADSWANQLLSRLTEAEQKVEQLREVNLHSSSLSFEMPDAAGWPTDSANLSVRIVQDLLTAPDAEIDTRWEKWVAEGERSSIPRSQLLLHVYRELYRRASADPARILDTVCSVFRQLENPLQPRPTEMNFLLLVQRDLPARPMPGDLATLVKLALSIHALGERAALGVRTSGQPYCEAVSPWVIDLVENGDTARLAGEDLLFGPASGYAKATEHLESAKAEYDKALDVADTIRSGLLLRDSVFAQLPYYCQWLARTTGRSNEAWLQGDQLIGDIETLWAEAHHLSNLLEPPDVEHRTTVLANIQQRHDNVSKGFDDLRQRFRGWTENLARVDVPSLWKDAEDVLVVPFDDASLRMRLRTKQRRATRRLLIETTGSNREFLERTDPKQNVRTRASRTGRLALAQLGKTVFGLVQQTKGETLDQVRHRMEVFQVERQWWKSLQVAGEQLANRRLALQNTVYGDLDKLFEKQRSEAQLVLRRDDFLVRLLDGATPREFPRSPVDSHRRMLLQDLLVRQAERSWNDHWASDRPNREPYYKSSGLSYLDDAKTILAWPDVVGATHAKLTKPGETLGIGPSVLQLTDGRATSVTFSLQPEKNAVLPTGMPALWLEAGSGLALEKPLAKQRTIRVLDKTGKISEALPCTLNSPALGKVEDDPPSQPKKEATTLTLHGLFRGQRITKTTPVELHYAPDRVEVSVPTPNRASVTVRASEALHDKFGEGNGGIAIVLDCSGSMGPAQGQQFTATTKYAEALTALRQVLAKLPKGTTVSLWTFGQAMGSAKTVEQAERTVQRVLAPTRWNPDNSGQLESLMKKISYPTLEPWNESPIVHTLLKAKEDLKDVAGLKSLLVLTDGMDNRYQSDTTIANRNKPLGQLLRAAFQDQAILVDIVGFKVVDAEEKKAKEQWETVKTLSPPGNFYTVEDGKTLASVLAGAMRQRLRYWVEDYDNHRLPHELRGIDVGRGRLSGTWFPGGLAPGGYKVRSFTNAPVESDITVAPGDLLPLELTAVGSKLEFRRYLYSEGDYPSKPHQSSQGWRLSALQDQLLNPRALQMLHTLEKTPSTGVSSLQQIHPKQVWFELDDPDRTITQRWRGEHGYPAPAWGLDVPAWPTTEGRPTTRVWWSPDQRSPATVVLSKGNDFQKIDELRGRIIELPDGSVTVDRVTIEEHTVEIGPNRRARRSCLVVKLSHPSGKPYWPESIGLDVSGSEQRFYTRIGKSTTLFWPVTADVLAKSLRQLRLTSVEQFRAEAKRRGYFLELSNLAAPQPGDLRPRPVTLTGSTPGVLPDLD